MHEAKMHETCTSNSRIIWSILVSKIFCRLRSLHIVTCMCVTIDGIWIDEFIDHLYTRLGITSNYSATATLHSSQITTAPAKPFPSLLSSLAVSWQRRLTVEILELRELRFDYTE
jgi:hypothetical protein